MTAKRFQWVYIKDNSLELRDNGIVKAFDNERLEELLNELDEENDGLKRQIVSLRVELDTHKHPLWSTREAENKIKELADENEQLKKEILWWKYRCGEDISGDVE